MGKRVCTSMLLMVITLMPVYMPRCLLTWRGGDSNCTDAHHTNACHMDSCHMGPYHMDPVRADPFRTDPCQFDVCHAESGHVTQLITQGPTSARPSRHRRQPSQQQ